MIGIGSNLFSMNYPVVNTLLDNIKDSDLVFLKRQLKLNLDNPLDRANFEIKFGTLNQILGFWNFNPSKAQLDSNYNFLIKRYSKGLRFKVLSLARQRLKEIDNVFDKLKLIVERICQNVVPIKLVLVPILDILNNTDLNFDQQIKKIEDDIRRRAAFFSCDLFKGIIDILSSDGDSYDKVHNIEGEIRRLFIKSRLEDKRLKEYILLEDEIKMLERSGIIGNSAVMGINNRKFDSDMSLKEYSITLLNNYYKKTELADKEKVDVSIVRTYAFWDILSSFQDINSIARLGSSDKNKIYWASKFEHFRNVFSCLTTSLKTASILNLNLSSSNTLNKLRFLHLLPDLMNLKLIGKNLEILHNNEKIANNHKNSKKDLSTNRKYQYLWLAINKVAPYVGFAVMRSLNQERNNSMFYESNSLNIKPNDCTLKVFEFLKFLSNISEAFRRKRLYVSQMQLV